MTPSARPLILILFLLVQACSSGQPEGERLPATTTEVPKLRGMTFAHEGYDGVRGYGGEMMYPSLDSLATLNVNALSIVPYTFMRDAGKPTELPVPDFGGGESDANVIITIREARRRGWFVLLKPQIWLGGGSWPGDVDFATNADWASFFGHYRKWILHYARMAAAENVEALCIGTELVRTTLERPDDWRALIGEIRGVYAGKLTYASNWGEEFEKLTFWDELDAIGLNSYYPLAEKDAPTDAELLAGARRWMTMADAKAERAGKPLWLTETGFRSARRAWLNPHAAAGDRPVSLSCQDRSYRALITAAGDAEHLTGIFWWKWPSYLGYDGGRRENGKGFNVVGKPAETTLRQFYAKWR